MLGNALSMKDHQASGIRSNAKDDMSYSTSATHPPPRKHLVTAFTYISRSHDHNDCFPAFLGCNLVGESKQVKIGHRYNNMVPFHSNTIWFLKCVL